MIEISVFLSAYTKPVLSVTWKQSFSGCFVHHSRPKVTVASFMSSDTTYPITVSGVRRLSVVKINELPKRMSKISLYPGLLYKSSAWVHSQSCKTRRARKIYWGQFCSHSTRGFLYRQKALSTILRSGSRYNSIKWLCMWGCSYLEWIEVRDTGEFIELLSRYLCRHHNFGASCSPVKNGHASSMLTSYR